MPTEVVSAPAKGPTGLLATSGRLPSPCAGYLSLNAKKAERPPFLSTTKRELE